MRLGRPSWLSIRAVRLGYNLLLMAMIFASEAFAKPGHGHGHAYGRGKGVPELDPGLIFGAVTLLVGGIIAIRDHRRQK